MNLMIYLVSVNIIGFVLCYVDKIRAIKHRYRISESILLLISLVGGSFGFLLSMHIFHHKTKKLKFKLVYVFCFLWGLIIYRLSLL